jgi:hypothetical protein
MGAILGNKLHAIEAQTGVETRKAMEALEARIVALQTELTRATSRGQSLVRHSSLQELDYASAGHTGFASTAALTSHTGSTANPHATTLDQAVTAGASTSTEATFNGGVDLGTSGRIDSNVLDSGTNIGVLIKPSVAYTTGRNVFQLSNSAGSVVMNVHPTNFIEFGGTAGAALDGIMGVAATTAKNLGINFVPITMTGSGGALMNFAAVVSAAFFRAIHRPPQQPQSILEVRLEV